MNTLTAAELKRRGMAAIEEGLQRGPLRLIKHNRSAAVVLTESEYQRLSMPRGGELVGLTALQWLLQQPTAGKRSKKDIDASLADARQW